MRAVAAARPAALRQGASHSRAEVARRVGTGDKPSEARGFPAKNSQISSYRNLTPELSRAAKRRRLVRIVRLRVAD